MWTLLADDNREIRGALRLLLRELAGTEVAEASDMSEALEACASRSPAGPGLTLLDWELPAGSFRHADPAAFVAALREAAPQSYLVAMSARPEAKDQSLRAGCDAFVSRTDPPDRLVQLILRMPDPGRGGPGG
jgi:CheY-like chemotaxis protein